MALSTGQNISFLPEPVWADGAVSTLVLKASDTGEANGKRLRRPDPREKGNE